MAPDSNKKNKKHSNMNMWVMDNAATKEFHLQVYSTFWHLYPNDVHFPILPIN